MDHGLNDIGFYVQKHIALRAVCYNFPLVREKPLGHSHMWESSLWRNYATIIYIYMDIDDLKQGCNNSISNAQELLQSCTKP